MDNPLVTLSAEGEIGIILINNPPVNAFGPGVAKQLAIAVQQFESDEKLKAAVVLGAGSTFVAGADIKQFVRMSSGEIPYDNLLSPVLAQIENAKKPFVMSIHGSALGGGLELAMSGHYRVAAPDAQVGQPEVKLGLIPGAGGTQRLTRLAGLATAVEMCAFGEPIKAPEGLQAGILDKLIEGDLQAGAVAFARDIAGQPFRRTCDRQERLASPDENEVATAEARVKANNNYRGFQAPLLAIDSVEAAAKLPFEEGLAFEAQLFEKCLYSDQSKALIHVFFGEREVAKIPGISKDTPLVAIKHAAVLGGSTTARKLVPAFERLGITASDVSTADLILIAGENSEEQEQSFEEALRDSKPGAIFAISGAQFDLEKLARLTPQPEYLVGLHFPPWKQSRAMELIRTSATSSSVVATVFQLAKKMKKVAIVTAASSPVGANIYDALLDEARNLVDEGLSPDSIDRALSDFGFAESPLRAAGIHSASPTSAGSLIKAVSTEPIIECCVYAMINESARALGASVVLRASDLDMLCVLGYGFPAYRGGPLWYADSVGLSKIYESILNFRKKFGNRWTPAPLLQELAQAGKHFGDFNAGKSAAR
jgi:3-hydroxyacyl-CoA dehydrogenase